MRFIRKHKKLSIIILCSLIVFILFTATLGRYIYNVIDNYILETKGFYFNSSVLSINTKESKINNWDGTNSYQILVDLNNIKNSFVHTEADIEYNVEVQCSSGVTCRASKLTGTLYEASQTDGFTITMTPNSKFDAGESAEVNVSVYSLKPYKKTLKGKFIISVENSDFTYNIEDAAKDKFMTLNMTNSVAYYEVETAFGNYQVGDIINLDDYDKLTATEKENCFSAIVTISFDPSVVYLDMTANSYLNRIENSETTTTINGYTYINGYKFKVDATSSEKIIFYKANKNNNYTYPLVNETSIISVTSEIAE